MAVDKLLSGAVRLWVQSQVSTVDDLNLKIVGKNKQILQGYIPQVFISATDVVYQEIQVSRLEIVGNNIRFNLPQVVKRKPLQLVEPIIIKIEVLLKEIDLQKSLSSPILATGLTDLWSRFLSAEGGHPQAPPLQGGERMTSDVASLAFNKEYYQWNCLSLSEARLCCKGTYKKLENDDLPIGMDTKIELNDSHTLLLSPLKIITIPELPITKTENLTLDLGQQVSIARLEITEEHLLVRGTITVFP